MTPNLDQLRLDTPGCRQRIHFNNAGASLVPSAVLDAMLDHLRLEAEIGGYEAAEERSAEIAEFYAAGAELLGCQPRNVAFAASATDAFSRALSAVPFERGDVLLTTRDDYISNQIAFLSLRKRFGIEVVHAPNAPQGGVDLEQMHQLMRRHRPRAIVATHVPTNSGLVQPIAEIGRRCRELELLYIVDACQSAGQLPLDVRAIECDFLSITCRKFVRGPRGAGLLYVSDRALDHGYEPLFIDMRGARWSEPSRYEPAPGAQRFEDWEFPYAALIGSAAAIRYACNLSLEWISARVMALAERLRSSLAAIDRVHVLDRGPELCAIVTATIDGWEPDAAKAALQARNINCSLSFREYARYDFGEKGVEWCLRLSPHYYNSEEEVDNVAAGIAEISDPSLRHV